MTGVCACGARATLVQQTRCRRCYRREHTRRMRRAKAHGTWEPYVDAVGTRRRMRALCAIGWSLDMQAEHMGVSRSAAEKWLTDGKDRVAAFAAERVRRMYGQLAWKFGPSAEARRQARRKGWATPLMWEDEDLDNPAAEPSPYQVDLDIPRTRLDESVVASLIAGRKVPASPAERIEAVRVLVVHGRLTDGEIAAKLHTRTRSVLRIRRQAGIASAHSSGRAA